MAKKVLCKNCGDLLMPGYEPTDVGKWGPQNGWVHAMIGSMRCFTIEVQLAEPVNPLTDGIEAVLYGPQ